MKKDRSFKQRILAAFMAIVMLTSSLIGTTFAWFTDSVTSGNNIVQTGNLDAQMHWSETLLAYDSDEWQDAEDGTPVFNYNNWEPGYTEVRYVKVSNAGSLAFKWKLNIEANGTVTSLADVIDVYYVKPVNSQITSLDGLTSAGKLSDVLATKTASSGTLTRGGYEIFAIAFHMDELAGNEYQNTSLCDGGFSLKLLATQATGESDSFGPDYDAEAQWPEGIVIGNTASATVTADANNKLTAGASMISADGKISASVPAGTLLSAGTNKLTLNVANIDKSQANITLDENEAALSIDVHILGVAENNETVMAISVKELLPVGLNMGNYRFYHVEDGQTVEMTLLADGATPVHNNYEYDPATGDVVLHLASFSEVALVADTENAWEGNFDYTWYDASKTDFVIANADQLAAFGAIVGGMDGQTQDSFKGKTVKLLADINLGDKESENKSDIIFYPIGYYNSEGTYERTNTAITSGLRNFEGTFDGNGHTVSNFYHNTWEMKGDNNYYDATLQYYRDGMGLFGRVYGGTIKNLTVSNFSSDGEYTTTGAIAAYADGATFENIAIFNCNPRVYNIGNGGIVGCVGWYAKEANLKTTFKNITVDNSNKISALWGSYDVACGGIVGQYYPTSGQTSANKPVNGGMHFDNCHVSAQMDVYNDVCANYQYYAYRYAGMMIGSIRENTTNEDGKTIPDMTGISATGCTVNYGDWNDYYYCEFEKNGHPSYSGPDDYKFSRVPHSELNFTDSNGNGVVDADERASVTGCNHNHTDKEDNQAIFLPFYQLFTGYGWGVSSIGLKEYSGIVTNLGITEGDQQESVEKFKGKDGLKELANNKEYKLGDIFTLIENSGVELMREAIVVGITNINENNPVSATIVYDRENWENSTIKFTGTGKVKITIQDYYFCTPTTIEVTITERQNAEKFDVVMNNGDFLHRVGNVGTVALDKLFKAKDGVTVGTVSVTVEAVNGTVASGSYFNNVIQFSGTGVVKVTIKDDDKYCIPTVLYLEVVNATNVTGATNATSNNVVLLDNSSFGSLEVKNGYAFYGNGFTITCSSDSVAIDRSYGFVVLENGILDNVQVIVPNFSHAILFDSNKTEGGNPSKTENGRTRYNNIRSAVVMTGNSTIANSYVSGGRAAVYVANGNANVINSTVYGGAAANIHVEASASVTLNDITLVQKPIQANVNDTSKTLMGLSIVTLCNSDGIGGSITIEGTFKQYAWARESYKTYVPEDGQSLVSTVLSETDYTHQITFEDGVTATAVNLGICYIPDGALGTAPYVNNLSDNRSESEKAAFAYGVAEVSKAKIYTYKNINGTHNDLKSEPSYSANKQKNILPNVVFTDTNTDRVFSTSYDKSNGWTAIISIDLDKGNYTFNFSNLLVQKYGKNLSYTVSLIDGTAVDKNSNIVLNDTGSKVYVLTIIDDQIYNSNAVLTGETVSQTYMLDIQTSKTSISGPKWGTKPIPNESQVKYVKKGSLSSDWTIAVPVLNGGVITYWSKAAQAYVDLDLTSITPRDNGKQNNGASEWVYTVDGEYTLRITTSVFKTGYDGMPVVYEENGVKTLYFTLANKSGFLGSGTKSKTLTVTYEFTDSNNNTLSDNSVVWSITRSNIESNSIVYDSFVSGGGSNPGSSGDDDGCVTPDTLITLADGTQVRVDSLKGDEMLLVWNMETGKLDFAPIMFVDSDPEAEYEIIHLYFSDGTDVKVIYEHGFWDYDLNKYVYLDRNAADYIGHSFAKQNGDSLEKVTLVDVVIETELTTAWSPVTVGHLCYFVNGMLSMPGGVGGLFNIFEVDPETMTYDYEQLEKDIETYGLYTYEELNAICPLTEEMFNAAGGAYLKISIGKGNLTIDELINMINRYSKYI